MLDGRNQEFWEHQESFAVICSAKFTEHGKGGQFRDAVRRYATSSEISRLNLANTRKS